MPSWFKKNPEPEKSPGGSIIHRHQNPGKPKLGFSDRSAGYVEAREAVYQRLFGECSSVSHELLPQIPHIDVYTHLASENGRRFCTLVTGGMSDLPMKLPPQAEDMPRRVELIFYCSEPKEEYLQTMRWLAHFPHDYKTWVGDGHTIPNGTPPAPMWDSPVLDTVLLMPPIVKRDQTLPDELTIDGDPVHFLWMVPLTKQECDLKLAKGFNAILDLFTKNRHPHVFDPKRKSYV